MSSVDVINTRRCGIWRDACLEPRQPGCEDDKRDVRVASVSHAHSSTIDRLREKGVEVSDHGMKVKTKRAYKSREDYMDATQR